MEEQTLELRGIVSRLERVEKQNRWLKKACMVSLLLPACIVVMAQANRRETVEAESFVLKDAKGNKRAELTMGREDASLFFFDAQGRQTSHLSDGFVFLVDPETAKPGYVMLAAGQSSPSITVQDSEGFTATLGVTETVTKRNREKRTKSAASLILFDKDQKILWSAP